MTDRIPPEILDAMLDELEKCARAHGRKAQLWLALALLMAFASGVVVGGAF